MTKRIDFGLFCLRAFSDEISLADDSVLERLNSVLETDRSLLLSEKAGGKEPELIRAADSFRFLATMNPGGDYGKKELSPALRNRLTEIWCPISRDKQDMIDIIEHNLQHGLVLTHNQQELSIASSMVEFISWFSSSDIGRRATVSIRDILSWVRFINAVTGNDAVSTMMAYIHGACLVFLDSLGSRRATEEAIAHLIQPISQTLGIRPNVASILGGTCGQVGVSWRDGLFGVDPFYIRMKEPSSPASLSLANAFTFNAPSTSVNVTRLLRALQLTKPLLLEGSPGVGKTSLVAALAQAAGHELVRINLSEQTDVSDLFGADLPVEGSDKGGHFEWRDGPLLRALKEGKWIVLDELNLASQSVLEGLNAVLDHRGELYIPELGRMFRVQPQMTKLFACQNPLRQGGARKGLPRSFLNRFTQVFIEALTRHDLQFIAQSVYPKIDSSIINKMVEFNQLLVEQVLEQGQWGIRGGPWEFNLRDIFRWCQATTELSSPGEPVNPGRYVGLIYADRMRSALDRQKMLDTYEAVFGAEYPLQRRDIHVRVSQQWLQVGCAILPRGNHETLTTDASSSHEEDILLLQRNLKPLESLMLSVRSKWLSILVSIIITIVDLLSQVGGFQIDG